MSTQLDFWLNWLPFDDEEVIDALSELAGRSSAPSRPSTLATARCTKLSFYDRHRLIELRFSSERGDEYVFGLDGPDQIWWLDGESHPIHDTNEVEALELTDGTALDYVRFFLFFVRGESGPFVLIEGANELDVIRGANGMDAQRLLSRVRPLVVPLAEPVLQADGSWEIDCSVVYDGALFTAKLNLTRDGNVEMVDDEPVADLSGISIPEYPPLGRVSPATNSTPSVPSAVNRDGTESPPSVADNGDAGSILEQSDDLVRDRDVTEAVVAVLLEDAIRERDATVAGASMLLEHFNAETGGNTPIERLTRLISDSVPVIIIESDIPFVEDFVAGLMDGPSGTISGGRISRARVVGPGEELRCVVDYDSTTKLHLLSFHVYRGLFDAERTAHELALRDATVLIGCQRAADVPEPLRRIADLVLTFPRIDRRRFARIFERVFRARPTHDWDAPGADWTRYLVPADFHTPRRLRLHPDAALLLLKERVEARLRQVTPDVGPRLADLHGLGEARQITEDFITDIRAAQAGQIPWSAVDRGLLLAGAPGTGKTTLARALAAECGIKFVVASAARWQSAGALDAHLLAMRADFAEARRYAPAILFIDEIDSIGSREHISGDHNVVYQTDVINALLEQIEGIDTAEPVIVIAATNYLERVDPALRRAGRLDQSVHLPLPNVPSLERIFDYHLEQYRADNEPARDIHTRTLAQLSLGLTGADVEFFVRGAARRARRANRSINQEDLVAEITRRPRRPDAGPRLGAEEMKRTAVHEAGHAVARLISSSGGADLAFITIIPRLNGSLGFVARAPEGGQALTRRAMLDELETALAGRAAEEVVFGANEVGAGAGGPSKDSDLAVATRTATLVVCQSGLGEDRALLWTERPTPAQETQIEALLSRAYTGIVARLESHRALLDQIVAILVDKQEVSGTDLRQLLAETTASAAG